MWDQYCQFPLTPPSRWRVSVIRWACTPTSLYQQLGVILKVSGWNSQGRNHIREQTLCVCVYGCMYIVCMCVCVCETRDSQDVGILGLE